LFQDIAPYEFRNEYDVKPPKSTDYMIFAKNNMILMKIYEGGMTLPRFEEAAQLFPGAVTAPTYLFCVDETSFFLSLHEVREDAHFKYQNAFVFRDLEPGWLGYAGATAAHLALWYDTHRFCGRCATPTEHKSDERAVVCPNCGNIEYPKIAPVVIVGVTDGDRLLLTKYAAGYNRYALVAGFVEIGETLENAVRREVLEEVGLRVRNIRYFKSQPWAFSGSLLSGFYADLDGSDTVRVDAKELAEAAWFDRRDIPRDGNTMSLTWTMVEAFRSGEAPK
jgi:NAD+ diphosphatase